MSNNELREAVIVSSLRTPVGRAFKGTYKDVRPEDLGACAVRAAIDAVPGLKDDEVEDVIIGCAYPEGPQGLNMARVISILAGLPVSVPAQTVNRFCSSGLQAIATGAERIMAGFADVIVAGGTESMTSVPMTGFHPRPHPETIEKNPEVFMGMGLTAEVVAKRYKISREDQDAFAVESHAKAIAAQKAGKFNDEIVEAFGLAQDECPREGTSAERLSGLRPAFAAGGSVTPGTSSPLSDGAAATVIMSRAKAEELGAEILGVFRGFAVAGVEPDEMGIGPVVAFPKLLAQTGLALEDIDLIELNEAFSSQSLYCIRKLGLDTSKVNVNGGALALGHPLGATGAKLTATLLHELKRSGGRYGVVTMCIGGGMGAAGLFERV